MEGGWLAMDGAGPDGYADARLDGPFEPIVERFNFSGTTVFKDAVPGASTPGRPSDMPRLGL